MDHPFQWLALLVAARPSSQHTIYARHPHGFAGHMLRSQAVTLYYLQCARSDVLEELFSSFPGVVGHRLGQPAARANNNEFSHSRLHRRLSYVAMSRLVLWVQWQRSRRLVEM